VEMEARTFEVFMDQNNKCNLKCRMCGFSDPRVAGLSKYDMPIAVFRRIAEQIFPKASYVALSCMTEPLMTRDFGERLEIVKRSGVPFVDVITNGMLLDETIARRLVETRVTRLAVSIDGATKDVYEAIRIGASFERVTGNVRRFMEIRREMGATAPLLRINHVLSEANIDQFDAFLALASSLGAEAIDVRSIARFSNALDTGTSSRAFFDKIAGVRERLDRWCERTGVQNVGVLRWQPTLIEVFDEAGAKLTCRRPWNTVAIHANGDVMPCISWTRTPLGNIARQDFDEIRSGAVAAGVRAEFEAQRPGIDCEHCTIKKDAAVPDEEHDDFFYRMIAKPAPSVAS
jgi:radical SAM protein with 4Fe4S-binding SPASM domain